MALALLVIVIQSLSHSTSAYAITSPPSMPTSHAKQAALDCPAVGSMGSVELFGREAESQINCDGQNISQYILGWQRGYS